MVSDIVNDNVNGRKARQTERVKTYIQIRNFAMESLASFTENSSEVVSRIYSSVTNPFKRKKQRKYIQSDTTKLEKRLKSKTEFRVSKVEVKKYEVIDQIKIHYDDDTEWSFGPDCGDDDPRALIMTSGEYLIRVTHEKLIDHESAAATVEFETNKGRVFKFAPSELESITLGRDEDITTVIADEGYEIVSLIIRRGQLIGTEQQPVPAEDLEQSFLGAWYVMAYYAEKEDLDGGELVLEGTSPTVPVSLSKKKKKRRKSSSTGDNKEDTAEVLTGDRKLENSENAGTTTAIHRKKRTSDKKEDEEEKQGKEEESESDKKVDSEEENGVEDEGSDNDSDSDDDDGEENIDDLDIDYYHFYDKHQMNKAWSQIKHATHAKKGRGAILIDCLESTLLKKTGNTRAIDHCREKAIKRGYCLPADEDSVSYVEVFVTLYSRIAGTAEILMFISSILVMLVNFAVGVRSTLLEAEILTAIVTNPNTSDWRVRSKLDKLLCDTVIECDDSYLSLCQTLMISFFISRMSLTLFNMVNDFLMRYISDTKTAKMGRDLFVHALSLDKRFYDETRNISKYMNVESLQELMFEIIPTIVTSSIRYLVVCYYLVTMDFYLGVMSIAFTTFFNYFVVSYFIKADIEAWKKRQQVDRVHYQISSDVLQMIKTVKTFSKEKHHEKEYDEWFQSLIKNMKSGIRWEYFRSFFEQFVETFEYIIIVYFGYMQYNGETKLTPSEFTGFIILYQQLQTLFNTIRSNFIYVGRSFHDVERCNALRDAESQMKDGDQKPDDIKGEIVFNDVKFRYPSRPKDQVLKGLNLTIKPNQTTAIVGHSGAGKSTIAKMITRLYDPTSGYITVDGQDLKSYKIEHYRSKIAVVDQSPELFNRPLAENIAYGMVNSDDVTYEKIEEAGKIANCDFIKDFREGYYTFAGYSGCDLSGGQLQRIAIARAAIRDPKILVLDEATSSLDSNNEKEVQEALEKLMKGRTVIVIAHRLSTIRNADNIVCMKNGNVAEQGTHDELMALKGAYHKLVSQQIVKEKKEDGKDNKEENTCESDASSKPDTESDSSSKPGIESCLEKIGEKSDDDEISMASSIKNMMGNTLDSGNVSMTSELDNVDDVPAEDDVENDETIKSIAVVNDQERKNEEKEKQEKC